MEHEKSLESFTQFAKHQYKSETKVWVYLFLVLSLIYGVSEFVSGWNYFAKGSLPENWPLLVLARTSAIFLTLYGIRLVSLFTWYVIIFWLLRWFPVIRKEKFSSIHD